MAPLPPASPLPKSDPQIYHSLKILLYDPLLSVGQPDSFMHTVEPLKMFRLYFTNMTRTIVTNLSVLVEGNLSRLLITMFYS